MDSNDLQSAQRRHDLRTALDRIYELHEQISSLPRGYVSRKTIKGKVRHYRQWRDEDGKVQSVYIKEPDYETVAAGIERRRQLEEELAELEDYVQQGFRTRTPEIRTFLLRYDRGKDGGLDIQVEEDKTKGCHPPVASHPGQSPAFSSAQKALRTVAQRLTAQGILTVDQIAEVTGLSPEEIKALGDAAQ